MVLGFKRDAIAKQWQAIAKQWQEQQEQDEEDLVDSPASARAVSGILAEAFKCAKDRLSTQARTRRKLAADELAAQARARAAEVRRQVSGSWTG